MIDLIDECASKLRIEIDSMPAEIEEINRKITQVEIKRQALKKETDPVSKERLIKLEAELGNMNEELLNQALLFHALYISFAIDCLIFLVSDFC